MSLNAIPAWLLRQTADDLSSLGDALKQAASGVGNSESGNLVRDVGTLHRVIRRLEQDARYGLEFLAGVVERRGGAR